MLQKKKKIVKFKIPVISNTISYGYKIQICYARLIDNFKYNSFML